VNIEMETLEEARKRMMTGTAAARRALQPRQRLNDGYKALGLESRGVCWTIATVGLLMTFTGIFALVGVPLMVWSLVADQMIVKHREGK
jgi:hypothetical protein